jgi:hypothetical protein
LARGDRRLMYQSQLLRCAGGLIIHRLRHERWVQRCDKLLIVDAVLNFISNPSFGGAIFYPLVLPEPPLISGPTATPSSISLDSNLLGLRSLCWWVKMFPSRWSVITCRFLGSSILNCTVQRAEQVGLVSPWNSLVLGQDAWVFSLHLQAFPRIASCAWRLTVESKRKGIVGSSVEWRLNSERMIRGYTVRTSYSWSGWTCRFLDFSSTLGDSTKKTQGKVVWKLTSLFVFWVLSFGMLFIWKLHQIHFVFLLIVLGYEALFYTSTSWSSQDLISLSAWKGIHFS